MDNKEIKYYAEEFVKEEIRKGNVIKGKDILKMLPEIIDTVYIDKNQLHKSIEQCASSSNPLNAILSLFGVQMIRKNSFSIIDNSLTDQWLSFNPRAFKTVVNKISNKIYELEDKANQTYDDEKKRRDELFEKNKELEEKYNKLKYNAELNEKMICERIQYILSLAGENADNEQLIELLKDINIDIYWNSNNAPFTDMAMFTEYTVDDKSQIRIKPCLIKNNLVYIKGIRTVIK